jgi:hypothetical protein
LCYTPGPHTFRIVLLASFLLLFYASAADAQVIHACAKNKGGAMRVVDDPAECTVREAAVSWVANN